MRPLSLGLDDNGSDTAFDPFFATGNVQSLGVKLRLHDFPFRFHFRDAFLWKVVSQKNLSPRRSKQALAVCDIRA